MIKMVLFVLLLIEYMSIHDIGHPLVEASVEITVPSRNGGLHSTMAYELW